MDIVGFAAVALAVLVGIVGNETRFTRTDRRLARIERKLDLIMDHLDLREEDPRLDEVAGLARAGRKIEAIKAYREATGAGLKEAKDAVDRLAA
ncbi:ribosomal protein L7/L12 [Streptomyces sp. Li-HN-5-11]|uniref:ribosomal protein L7/L12 n=1 Tax=Streptomyces sp. Li-HN-5-11 TaxID=3075432 RepID=UPI0028A821C2|nr:ribosomal protein L7/L12 [Streptomyces sp. Li-HN-5-11]WNM28996.1 ribosomal protein L7/L12 [Streptomyces sp. Li-HN-5-11]